MVVVNDNNILPRFKCEFLSNAVVNYVNVNDFKITTKCTSTEFNEGISTQSPIAIHTNRCSKLQSPIHTCLCDYHNKKSMKINVNNNGFTAMITLPQLENRLVVKGGPLGDEFTFEQLHFHWSDNDDDGSEHSVDGKKYACEAHLVHFNSKYGSFENAMSKKDGLFVIGILMEISDSDNIKLDPIVNALYRVPKKYSQYNFTADSFFEWLTDADFNEYFLYPGSLTTEPYFETVLWFLVCKPINISRSQMTAFRNMEVYAGNKRISCNARPIQTPPSGFKMKYTGKMQIQSKL